MTKEKKRNEMKVSENKKKIPKFIEIKETI